MGNFRGDLPIVRVIRGSTRVEMRARRLEEFLGVERRRAFHPRIERIRRDRVELLARRQQKVTRIVDVHYPHIKRSLLREALEAFFEIRDVPGLKKKPSTSELLDWLKLLMAEDISPEVLRSQDQHKIIPPLHGALIKNEQDVHLFERLVFMSRRGKA